MNLVPFRFDPDIGTGADPSARRPSRRSRPAGTPRRRVGGGATGGGEAGLGLAVVGRGVVGGEDGCALPTGSGGNGKIMQLSCTSVTCKT